jgi:acetyl esterase/lipase
VRYDRHLMDDLCRDLAGRGWATWNLEYRRLGDGGGWPETFLDVAAGIDQLANLDEQLDLSRVVTIGHSAGGQLALWAAARAGLPAGAPGAESRVAVTAAVGQAAVSDLEEAHRLGLSQTVVRDLLDGPPTRHPERYVLASPISRLPLGVPQLLVHGEDDEIVPAAMSRRYQAAALDVGDVVELVALPGVGHFEHLDPRTEAWAAVVRFLAPLASRP